MRFHNLLLTIIVGAFSHVDFSCGDSNDGNHYIVKLSGGDSSTGPFYLAGSLYIDTQTSATLACKATSIQLVQKMKWTTRDKQNKTADFCALASLGSSCKYSLDTLTATFSNVAGYEEVTCTGEDKHGKDKSTAVLIVRRNRDVSITPPTFDITNQTEFAINCSSNDPKKKYDWYFKGAILKEKKDKYELHGDNGTLTVRQVTHGDGGIYKCVTRDAPQNLAFAVVKSEPYIDTRGKQPSKNKQHGDDVELECPVTGYPLPDKVIWSAKKDKDSKTEMNLYNNTRVSFDYYNGMDGGKMTIKKLEYSDRAEYTCTAITAEGRANATITLRVKDRLAALWPFIGIVAEVVILVAIIFFYERRRKMKEAREDARPDTAEQKVPLASNDQDVRQRKV